LRAEEPRDNAFIVNLTEDEFTYFSNVLNEVLRGFRVDNFEGRLKASRESSEALRAKLTGNIPCTDEVTLSASEITSLCNATRLCYEEFGDEEFSTRLGVSAKQALEKVDALESLLAGGTP
jgi:hypothetical protein